MFKLILSVIGLALAFGAFFLYTQPTYDSTKVLQAEISRYNEALSKAAELQQLKQSLLSRYNAFNPTDLTRLQKLLPDHVDNVRLILDLDNLAGAHGMAVQNVVISGPSSDANTSAVGTIGAVRQKVDSLTLKFSTAATYPQFAQFLGALESSLRLVDIVSLNLVPESSPLGGEPLYRFDITVRTYWLK